MPHCLAKYTLRVISLMQQALKAASYVRAPGACGHSAGFDGSQGSRKPLPRCPCQIRGEHCSALSHRIPSFIPLVG